ncbi:MAG: helix-turn-helix domain-containing protein [Anaerolineae bacterium]|nr:helix-turn-helix domain-containing protein [Anaerolineae bacterium]MDW8172856.1 helix-turn-helix domain-containing protein [Anaerolineae bacterium]
MMEVPSYPTQANYTPLDEMVIEDAETLRVLADPLRLRIRELMIEPCTVKQVAAALNMAPTKLYYHINLLEKHKLIIVVAARVVSGIIEKQYQISAKTTRVARHLLSPGTDEKSNSMQLTLDSLFKDAKADLLQSMQDKTVQMAHDTPDHHAMLVSSQRFYLTEEQATNLFARLKALLSEMDELSNAQLGRSDAQPYKMLALVFPSSRRALHTQE